MKEPQQRSRPRPGGLPLQEDLAAGRIERALLCHVHDRWYLGELFCHASWLACLRGAGIACSVCTNAPYLELFEHQPGVEGLHPAPELGEGLPARFDLVVFGTTHPPGAHDRSLPRAIYAWNEGLRLARHGRVELELQRAELNLFLATCHRHGQTALPDGEYLRLHLTSAERAKAAGWLDGLPGAGASPLVVFNPSASNAHTRATARPKAVENNLSAQDCERLIGHLLEELPDHLVLVAAPLKPGDVENHRVMTALGERFAGEPRLLAPMGEVDPEEGLSLRAFSALLADGRVQGMLGNSTGSNAHLAAALDVPAVSIERGADDEMRSNWRSPGRGQMGSFRWRNPQPCTAAVPLRWEDPSRAGLRGAARLLGRSMAARRLGWAAAVGVPAQSASARAAEALAGLSSVGEPSGAWAAGASAFAELLEPEQRAIAYDFRDEAEYFRATGRPGAAASMDRLTAIGEGAAGTASRAGGRAGLSAQERGAVQGMLASSNLLKELRAAAGATWAPPQPVRP